jgi:cystathionine gamma-lyase
LAFASGSAATATIVNSLPSGSHIVSVNDVYGGTYRYFTKVASTNGVEVTFVDLYDPNALKQALRPNTKVYFNRFNLRLP